MKFSVIEVSMERKNSWEVPSQTTPYQLEVDYRPQAFSDARSPKESNGWSIARLFKNRQGIRSYMEPRYLGASY